MASYGLRSDAMRSFILEMPVFSSNDSQFMVHGSLSKVERPMSEGAKSSEGPSSAAPNSPRTLCAEAVLRTSRRCKLMMRAAPPCAALRRRDPGRRKPDVACLGRNPLLALASLSSVVGHRSSLLQP